MTSYNSENKKECEGCYVNDKCTLKSSYIDPETNKVIKCPCINCIIKMMCYNGCEEYDKYYTYRCPPISCHVGKI